MLQRRALGFEFLICCCCFFLPFQAIKRKGALPPPLTAATIVVGDALLAAGLCIFSLGLKGGVMLAAAAAMRRVCARK